jgi:hypothetical protein
VQGGGGGGGYGLQSNLTAVEAPAQRVMKETVRAFQPDLKAST